jgi:hypothetical protein
MAQCIVPFGLRIVTTRNISYGWQSLAPYVMSTRLGSFRHHTGTFRGLMLPMILQLTSSSQQQVDQIKLSTYQVTLLFLVLRPILSVLVVRVVVHLLYQHRRRVVVVAEGLLSSTIHR